MVMSDRIGVMREGKLVQVGSPHEIYSAPTTRFVSEFIGDVNVIPVDVAGDDVPADLFADFERAFEVDLRADRPRAHCRLRQRFRRGFDGEPGVAFLAAFGDHGEARA